MLHRAAVAAEWRGSGMSQMMLRYVEEETRRTGRNWLRTDTHRKNKSMLNLLRENGFRYRGNISVSSEPGHDTERQAYEKLLKEKRA